MGNLFRKIFCLIFIFPIFGFSQNEFLDFVVNHDNDTIYGTIRNRTVLYEKNNNSKNDKIKFRSYRLKKFSIFRINDEVYVYQKPKFEDGVYNSKETLSSNDTIEKKIGNFINVQKKLTDFIITKTNDTIYGKIEEPRFGKLSLYDSFNNIIKIDKENIKRFRFNNEIFEHKEKKRVSPIDDNDAYLKLLIDGKVKLYEYEYNYNQNDLNSRQLLKQTDLYFYLEVDNELILINNLLYKKRLAEIFSKNQTLVYKILNEEYTIDNIYLIVKYYNEYN
ncbi:MAG: hypothetical protein ACOVNP_07870 [Flavobacterium sp.]